MKKNFYLALGVTLLLVFLSFNLNLIGTSDKDVTFSELIAAPNAIAENPVDWCNDWCATGDCCVLNTNVGFPVYCYGWTRPIWV